MVNVLIADDNVIFAKNLINYIISQIENVRIIKIATNGNEVIDCIVKDNIDLILLDLKMPHCNGIEVIEKIEQMHLSKNPKIIIISGDIESITQIRNNRLIADIATKTENVISIYNKIKRVIEDNKNTLQENQIKQRTLEELLSIGFNPKHKGTQYILECITYIYMSKDPNLLECIEKNVYRRIAFIHNKSEKNIKNNIVKATDFMYVETKEEILHKYFCNEADRKPTPKLIISRVLSKL